MSNISPPPIQHQMADDSMNATMPWVLFFNNMYNGDIGTSWIPEFANLTVTGTPTYEGRYVLLTKQLAYFRINIAPNGGNSTSTAGSTAITNFPLPFAQNGICFAVSGLVGTNAGMVNAPDRKIYTPNWSAVSVNLTIIGLVEVQ